MTASLPPNLEEFAKTKVFTEATFPNALRKDHATNEDSWGAINVHDGALIYTRADNLPERLIPGHPGTIFPGELHDVQPDGPVTFSITFYRLPKTVQK